jgi:hypothetical protein
LRERERERLDEAGGVLPRLECPQSKIFFLEKKNEKITYLVIIIIHSVFLWNFYFRKVIFFGMESSFYNFDEN